MSEFLTKHHPRNKKTRVSLQATPSFLLWAPLKIRVKPNADRISESNENDRRHSRKAMSREFEAAIGNYGKSGKMIIFRGDLIY